MPSDVVNWEATDDRGISLKTFLYFWLKDETDSEAIAVWVQRFCNFGPYWDKSLDSRFLGQGTKSCFA